MVQLFLVLDGVAVRYRFTLTPQRMRMIVEAFKDTLELGLEKKDQVVVRIIFFCPYSFLSLSLSLSLFPSTFYLALLATPLRSAPHSCLPTSALAHGDGMLGVVRTGRICRCHIVIAPFPSMHEYQFRLPSALITPRISPPTHGRRRTRSSSSGPRRGPNGSRSLCLRRLIFVKLSGLAWRMWRWRLRLCVWMGYGR